MTADMRAAFAEERDRFLAENPDIESVEVLLADSNGVARGKWLPAEALRGMEKSGVHLPISVFGETIWLWGMLDEQYGLSAGDPDGTCLPVPGTLRRIPWRKRPAAQVLLTMYEADGETPHRFDPRQVLGALAQRFAAVGLRPTVAMELEFCIYKRLKPDRELTRPRRSDFHDSRLYELDALQAVAPFLDQVRTFAHQQSIPVTALVSEMSPGQFELNLEHVTDACQAGDLAVLFKRLVKRVAAMHGFDATFMAKPVGDQPGNGCHVHVSLVNEKGDNVFNEPEARANHAGPKLLSAVAGCLESAPDIQLILAPHYNSYRRFQPGSFAPVRVCWGYDHRGASVRVAEASGSAARLEHRIAGADVQPYLLLTGVLGGMLDGMERQLEPGPAVKGWEYISEGPMLARHWRDARERFENSAFAAKVFGEGYRDLYAYIKRIEQDEMTKNVTDVEYESYFKRA